MLINFVNLTWYYLKRCCGVKDFLLLMSVKKITLRLLLLFYVKIITY